MIDEETQSITDEGKIRSINTNMTYYDDDDNDGRKIISFRLEHCNVELEFYATRTHLRNLSIQGNCTVCNNTIVIDGKMRR